MNYIYIEIRFSLFFSSSEYIRLCFLSQMRTVASTEVIVCNPTRSRFAVLFPSFAKTLLSVTIETRYLSGVRKYDVMLTQRQIIDDSSIGLFLLGGGPRKFPSISNIPQSWTESWIFFLSFMNNSMFAKFLFQYL